MELRHLRYFAAVAEELHFRRAAERLHVAQPAVSEQIRNLERELGSQLLHRTKREVSLTPAGTALLEEAHRMLRLADEARRAVKQAQEGVTGRLRLGLAPDVMPLALPRALRHFGSRYPAIDVSLVSTDPRRAIEDVRSGLLDAATVCLPAPVNGLQVTRLGVEGVVAAVADTQQAARLDSVDLRHLDGATLVVLPRDANPPFYDGLVGAVRDAGIAATFAETAEPLVEQALLGAVTGRGTALLPSSVVDRHAMRGIRFLPVAEPAPTCLAVLITRPEDQPLHVEAFTRLAAGAVRAPKAAPPVRVLAEAV